MSTTKQPELVAQEDKPESWATSVVSARTGARASLEHGPLPQADAPWLVEYRIDQQRGRWLQQQLPGRPWTLWRYRELLPLSSPADRVDLGEGGTPLVRLRRMVRSEVAVWLKEESGNPTGSFKARGLAVAVNRARELGASGVQLPSAGNAALAAAAYAAASGLACRVALPEDTPQVIGARCRLLGAEVLNRGRTLVEAANELTSLSPPFWDLSTFKEPYRVEGKKTMAFELAEQLEWQLPDWIIYPTGGGTGIVAMARAFAQLQALGLTDRPLPRLAAVQMEGCAPLVEAFRRGDQRAKPWSAPTTRVWGLRVPRSLADFLILRALQESGGTAITVPEQAVGKTQASAARQEGLLVGPEGAAALAGLGQLIDAGRIQAGDRVVVFQTGHPGNYL